MDSRKATYGLLRWQWIGLLIFIIIGLSHKLISTDKYLISFSPEVSLMTDKKSVNKGLPALIPYSAKTIDKKNRNKSPFGSQNVKSLYYRHWLGTDVIGRDVLAGILSGTNVAMRIGFAAVFFTILIGTILGYLSGYLGDYRFRVHWGWLLGSAMAIGLSLFYFLTGGLSVKLIAAGIMVLSLYILVIKSDSEDFSKGTVAVPFDMIIMRFIEIFNSIPDIFLVLVILALFRTASYGNIILIITLVKWPTVTRFLRAEIMALKQENYVRAAQAIGLPNWKIFKDSILPIAISPVIISCAFAFSTAILLESTLSFLGIGVPVDTMTWGSVLSEARERSSSWWLALFPGVMIYLTIFLFNSIGDNLNAYLRGERMVSTRRD